MASQKSYLKRGNIISWILIMVFVFSMMITSMIIYWNSSNNKIKKLVKESQETRQTIEQIYDDYINDNFKIDIENVEDSKIKFYYNEHYYYLYDDSQYLIIERSKNG